VYPVWTVADAADAFLARATAPTTRRSYAQTMSGLTAAHGTHPIKTLNTTGVTELATDSWGRLAPGHLEPTRGHAALVYRVLPSQRLVGG